MAPTNRVIIDTDPGIDDILALLLAFSAKPEEIEVLLVSLTFGNIEVRSCLRNAVSLFHIIERECNWRRERGLPEGFESLKACKPLVAVGAEGPLEDQKLMADYFHGKDGLGGIHETHPHLTPQQTWEHLFDPSGDSNVIGPVETGDPKQTLFTPSRKPAHLEMLRVLKENDPDTITIVAVGPLTNLALAAAEDPETFLRVKEVVVMGGAINIPGNVTPCAEFNSFADAVAAARVFALTSPTPTTTLPTGNIAGRTSLPPYPPSLSKQLTLKLFPVDITNRHSLSRGQYRAAVASVLSQGSPLAEWTTAFLAHTFATLESLNTDQEGDSASLSLHDPVCVWYAITATQPAWKVTDMSPEDIRVECAGQWTRGMCVVDRRTRKRRDDDEVSHDDNGNWLSNRGGNRVDRMDQSPGDDVLAAFLLERLFG